MTREEMTPEAYNRLIDAIGELLFTQGLKATTMDSIASALQISKRTLYEIFNSKNEMVLSALEASHQRHSAALKEIFQNSANVMEGILKGFLYHRDVMRRVHVDFFRDMDSLYAEARQHSSNNEKKMMEKFLAVFKKGARQGYFRKNVNFTLHCRLLWIQMESLKRMEELFPPDITLPEAYDSINISFLRSIASPKGMEMLDNMVENLKITT
ncbi:MAG: TetR/AcrR family transcriptional regulator [Bacteroides sp.]|nr:TetR/AcrR family transcriptional regulator [Bacteroides sp.]MDE6076434.1 TetR/AcrR family transcriptional regulator [Muribaculaceae bacterium]